MGGDALWNRWQPAYDTKHKRELRLSFLLPAAIVSSSSAGGDGGRSGRAVNARQDQSHRPSRSRKQQRTIDVTLAQDDSFGETGTTLWLSAQALSCYILHRVFGCSRQSAAPLGARANGGDGDGDRPITVVELGAGTGLVSIVALAAAAARGTAVDVTATDVRAVVDGVLAQNLNTALHAHVRGGRGRAAARARVLDWRHLPSTSSQSIAASPAEPCTSADSSSDGAEAGAEAWPSDVDLVLGSDLVYDTASIGPLLDATRHFLRPTPSSTSPSTPLSPAVAAQAGEGSSDGGVAVIAQEIRDPAQWHCFLDAARARGFAVTMVPPAVVAEMVERCLPAGSRHRPSPNDGDSEDDADVGDIVHDDGCASTVDRPFEDVAIIELRYHEPLTQP